MLSVLGDTIRVVARELAPFLPGPSKEILDRFAGSPARTPIFPR